MRRTRRQHATRVASREPGDAPCALVQEPIWTATALAVPFAPPPAALNRLVALGLDPTEATIVLAYQLFRFPRNYLAKAFRVSDAKVKKALDRGAALGFGRVSRRDLLKRPRPVDEAKRQKILVKREELMERIRRLARLVGMPDDAIP
jgi:hypothetical protein